MLRKKLLIGVLALAFVLVVGVSTADAYSTLRLGSKGADVVTLQTKLGGLTADGSFGNLTLAAVKAFQTNKGLTADGVVGPMTWAALMSGTTTTTGNLPAGCTSTVGYSSTTGQKCDSTTGSTVVTGPLTGGAGDADASHYGTGEKSSVTEGDSDVNVLGFKVEAMDSDVAVTNVKLSIENIEDPLTTSYKITKYLDSVDVYKGSTKLASVDASDFSKESGSNVYTKSVSLSNAIVKEDNKDAFYVKANMIDDVDTANMDAVLLFTLESFRFQDAEGVITTVVPTTDVENDVKLEDSSSNDTMDVKSSSNNPDDATVTVDTGSDTTDDVLALAFKLKTGSDSADVTLNSLPLTVTLDNNSTTDGTVEDVINSITVKIGSDEYEADLTDDNVTDGEGTATYTVDLDGEDVVLDGDSTTEVKVYVSFEGTDDENNYAESTTVVVDVDGADIDAETDNTELLGDVGGSQTGATLTLSSVGAEVSGYKWTVSSTGTIVDFFFTVEATGDEDVDVLASSVANSIAGTMVTLNTSGTPETAAAGYGVLSKYSGDSVTAIGSTGFTVASGDKTTFRVRYSVGSDTTTAATASDNGGWLEVKVTSVAGQTVPDEDQTSPTATVNL